MAGPGKHRSTMSGVDSSSHTPTLERPSDPIQVGTSSSAAPPTHECNFSMSSESIPRLDGPAVSSRDPSIMKRKRGRTRNIKLAKKKQAGEKLSVEISEVDRKIVGTDSGSFIAEGGCVVRKHATLQVSKWSKISEVDREVLRRMVGASFEVKDDIEDSTKVIDAQLNKQYRNYRHKLHIEKFLIHSSLEVAMKHPPDGITDDNWAYICKYFASPEFKKISDRNKINRAKQITTHTAGTKSFARFRQERKAETGAEVGPIDLYEITKYSKKKQGWVNEDAKEKHEKMKQLKSDSQVEGINPVTEEEICAQVLGQKSGYVRGCVAPKQTLSSYNQQYKVKLDELRRRAEHAEQENGEIKQQNIEIQQQNSEIQQKNNEMQLEMQEMKEMLKTLMDHVRGGGQVSSPR